MPDRYFCQDCGYTATSPGNCPTCNIELIETDDGLEESPAISKYSDLEIAGEEPKEISGDDEMLVRLDKAA